MSGDRNALTRDQILQYLLRASELRWGEHRTSEMRERLEQTADQLATIAGHLPHFEEVPTFTWHDRP